MQIEELLAREEIRATLARYNLSGDRGRVDELAACFTEDGVLEIDGDWTARGREEIRAHTGRVAKEGVGNTAPGLLRHQLSTQGIELESATEARAWTYFTAVTQNGPDHSGRYVDRLVKRNAEWLLAHRRVAIEWRAEHARVADLEAIRQLKAKYFRLMDTKDWDGWTDLFTEDARLDVSDDVPNGIIEGRPAISAGVRAALGNVLSVHHGHMPEIELTGPDTARAIWAMEDHLEYPEGRTPATVDGRGHYTEEYGRCEDGVWRIRSLVLRRIHLEHDGKRRIPRD